MEKGKGGKGKVIALKEAAARLVGRNREEVNPLEDLFEFCDKNFTRMTREECDRLIKRVRDAERT